MWVPRSIDWVVRWRLRRECYWELFKRPTLADLLDRTPELLETRTRSVRGRGDSPPDFRTVIEAGVDGRRAAAAAFGERAVASLAPGGAKFVGEERAKDTDVPLFGGRAAAGPAGGGGEGGARADVVRLPADGGEPLAEGLAGVEAFQQSQWLPSSGAAG